MEIHRSTSSSCSSSQQPDLEKAHLCPLHSLHPHFEALQNLYLEAFPLCERRDQKEWRNLVDSGWNAVAQASEEICPVSFLLLGIYGQQGQNDHPLSFCKGFVSVWNFRNFVYVEHFAVFPSLRGEGWGAKAMQALLDRFAGLPVILEVEPPQDEWAVRRIGFYERQGFTCLKRPYMQPPYRPGDSSFPLLLMSTRPDWLEMHFPEVCHILHREVYGVEH